MDSDSDTHRDLMNHYALYLTEIAKFENKGIKASAARARKHLGEMAKLAKVKRAEIQAAKNSMEGK
jgi:hypothetical protein